MRYSPPILNLGTKRWVIRFTPRPLYLQGKSPHPPLTGRTADHRAGLHALDTPKCLLPFREPKVSSVFQAVLKSLYWATLTSNTLRRCHKNNKSILLHSETPSDVSTAHKLVYNISCKDYRTSSPLKQRMVIYDRKGRVASEVCNTPIGMPILWNIWRISKPILRSAILTRTQMQIWERVT
jgi:hypothetical protein